MKVILISFILSLAWTSSAQVSVFTRYNGDKLTPCATIFGNKKVSDQVSLTYFGLVNQNWAEVQIGFSYAPAKWISLGLSAGLEQTQELYRCGSSLWIGKGKTSFLMLLEQGAGKENYWYKTTLAFQPTDNLSYGIRAWRFNGIGPVASLGIKKIDSKFWVMPAYDFEAESYNLLLGIDIKI